MVGRGKEYLPTLDYYRRLKIKSDREKPIDWDNIFYDLVGHNIYSLDPESADRYLSSSSKFIFSCWLRLKRNKISDLNSTVVAIAQLSATVGSAFGGEVSIEDYLPNADRDEDSNSYSEEACEVFWEFVEQEKPDKYMLQALGQNGAIEQYQRFKKKN